LVLVLACLYPLLLVYAAFDRHRGYAGLREFCVWFSRWFFLGYLSIVRMYRLREKPDPDRLRKISGTVYVANHRSSLDAILALAVFPSIRVPVKKTYLALPILGRIIRWMGCIPFDRESPESIVEGARAAREALAKGQNLFVFPEGTRAGPGRPLAFSDIFFRVALESDAPVVPVVLHSDVPFLAPDGRSVLTRYRGAWTIRVLDALGRDPRDRASDLRLQAHRAVTRELALLDRGNIERGGDHAQG